MTRLLMMVEATRRELRRKSPRQFRIAFVEALRDELNASSTNANYDTMQWYRAECDNWLCDQDDNGGRTTKDNLVNELGHLAKRLEVNG